MLFSKTLSLQRRIKKGNKIFLSESNTFRIKSKAIKVLSCKSFYTLLYPPLHCIGCVILKISDTLDIRYPSHRRYGQYLEKTTLLTRNVDSTFSERYGRQMCAYWAFVEFIIIILLFQAHSVWKDVYTEWPSTENGNYIIEDMQIPELDMLLASKEKGQTLAFSYLVNNKWDEKFQKFELQKANCVVKNHVDGVRLTSTHSSLYFKVKTLFGITHTRFSSNKFTF